MQLRLDALDAHLKRGQLAPLYTVSGGGNEALLAIEAADAIRTAARAAGYTERTTLQADSRWDWSQLAGAAQGLSLFAERRLLEIRLPSGKPGKEGAEALRAHAQHVPAGTGPDGRDDLLTLITLPRLERATRDAAWANALESAGVWIDVPAIERAQLPAWIAARLRRQSQSAAPDALEFIADRVEGNLLAAHQEVVKLGLLFPAGELAPAQIADSILNVARFDVFGLPAAMLAGDGLRVRRMIEGLRAEGEALPLVLWAVGEEVRTLLRAKDAADAGRPLAALTRELRLWGAREKLLPQALARVSVLQLARLLARCAEIDRLSKGLRAPAHDSDAWLELTDVALSVAGAQSTVPRR